jgi:TATA-binding protein-associated factor Taf7
VQLALSTFAGPAHPSDFPDPTYTHKQTHTHTHYQGDDDDSEEPAIPAAVAAAATLGGSDDDDEGDDEGDDEEEKVEAVEEDKIHPKLQAAIDALDEVTTHTNSSATNPLLNR